MSDAFFIARYDLCSFWPLEASHILQADNSLPPGKFQMQVFPAAGHFIQEDLPERTAEVVVEFLKRNDRSTLVLPPKVSELLALGKKV